MATHGQSCLLSCQRRALNYMLNLARSEVVLVVPALSKGSFIRYKHELCQTEMLPSLVLHLFTLSTATLKFIALGIPTVHLDLFPLFHKPKSSALDL